MCDCDYPLATVVHRLVTSLHPDKKGFVKTEVSMDCLLHGPFCVSQKVVPIYVNGKIVREETYDPCFKTGLRRAVIKRF